MGKTHRWVSECIALHVYLIYYVSASLKSISKFLRNTVITISVV